MGKLRKAEPGLIFASVILNADSFDFESFNKVWTDRYELENTFEPEFNPSLEYYSKEMGDNLKRYIICTSKPREREEMIDGKLWADSIEQETAIEGNRQLNIDIGLVLKEQVLLSTSKPYSHRIYLRDSIWAELTYTYENKSYHFLPWTYPDYQSEEKIKLFNSLRLGLF